MLDFIKIFRKYNSGLQKKKTKTNKQNTTPKNQNPHLNYNRQSSLLRLVLFLSSTYLNRETEHFYCPWGKKKKQQKKPPWQIQFEELKGKRMSLKCFCDVLYTENKTHTTSIYQLQISTGSWETPTGSKLKCTKAMMSLSDLYTSNVLHYKN